MDARLTENLEDLQAETLAEGDAPADPWPAQETPEAALARRMATGLHGLANMITASPPVADLLQHALSPRRVMLSIDHTGADPVQAVASLITAATRHGAQVTQSIVDGDVSWPERAGHGRGRYDVLIEWGPVGLWAYADRAQVCELVDGQWQPSAALSAAIDAGQAQA